MLASMHSLLVFTLSPSLFSSSLCSPLLTSCLCFGSLAAGQGGVHPAAHGRRLHADRLHDAAAGGRCRPRDKGQDGPGRGVPAGQPTQQPAHQPRHGAAQTCIGAGRHGRVGCRLLMMWVCMHTCNRNVRDRLALEQVGMAGLLMVDHSIGS